MLPTDHFSLAASAAHPSPTPEQYAAAYGGYAASPHDIGTALASGVDAAKLSVFVERMRRALVPRADFACSTCDRVEDLGGARMPSCPPRRELRGPYLPATVDPQGAERADLRRALRTAVAEIHHLKGALKKAKKALHTQHNNFRAMQGLPDQDERDPQPAFAEKTAERMGIITQVCRDWRVNPRPSKRERAAKKAS